MCTVLHCSGNTGKKSIFCRKHWDMLGSDLQQTIREGTEKGSQTLRVAPSKEWLAKAAAVIGLPFRNIVTAGKPQKRKAAE